MVKFDKFNKNFIFEFNKVNVIILQKMIIKNDTVVALINIINIGWPLNVTTTSLRGLIASNKDLLYDIWWDLQ